METKTIHEAFLAVQKRMKNITKDDSYNVGNGRKINFLNISSVIEALYPILHEEGFYVRQPIEEHVLKTLIVYAHTGESFDSSMLIPEKNKEQDLGAAITYYRRYALLSACGIAAKEDDNDGRTRDDSDTPTKEYAPRGPLKGQVTDKQVDLIKRLLDNDSELIDSVCSSYKVKSLQELSKQDAYEIIEGLKE